jgi:hypothetical protein
MNRRYSAVAMAALVMGAVALTATEASAMVKDPGTGPKAWPRLRSTGRTKGPATQDPRSRTLNTVTRTTILGPRRPASRDRPFRVCPTGTVLRRSGRAQPRSAVQGSPWARCGCTGVVTHRPFSAVSPYLCLAQVRRSSSGAGSSSALAMGRQSLGQGCCFHPARGAGLAQDVGDVDADGRRGDEEVLGDFTVRSPRH